MLTADVPTLAESFRAGGYTTGGIVSAPYVEARYGFARGFDHYDDRSIRFTTHGESYGGITAPELQKTADAWLSANADRRFFLFLHYWDVHYDYAPGPPYDTMFDPHYDGEIDGENFYFNPAVNRHMQRRDLEHLIALYDGEIRLVDDHLGQLRKTLERLSIAQRTVIVVTADHGDEFFEHGNKGHHRSLYDEIIRVPFVLYVPGVPPTRRTVEMETSIIDIMPTVLSLVGLRIPAGVEGVDLSGIAYRGEDPWDRLTLSELYRMNSLNVQAAIRQRGAKLIHHFNRRLAEAYDLERDPQEQRPGALEAGVREHLFGRLHQELDRLWPLYFSRVDQQGIAAVEVDSDTQGRLEALGYME
jgi:arylsulfatase A-like enzyme